MADEFGNIAQYELPFQEPVQNYTPRGPGAGPASLAEGIFTRMRQQQAEKVAREERQKKQTLSVLTELAKNADPRSMATITSLMGDVIGLKGKSRNIWDRLSGRTDFQQQLGNIWGQLKEPGKIVSEGDVNSAIQRIRQQQADQYNQTGTQNATALASRSGWNPFSTSNTQTTMNLPAGYNPAQVQQGIQDTNALTGRPAQVPSSPATNYQYAQDKFGNFIPPPSGNQILGNTITARPAPIAGQGQPQQPQSQDVLNSLLGSIARGEQLNLSGTNEPLPEQYRNSIVMQNPAELMARREALGVGLQGQMWQNRLNTVNQQKMWHDQYMGITREKIQAMKNEGMSDRDINKGALGYAIEAVQNGQDRQVSDTGRLIPEGDDYYKAIQDQQAKDKSKLEGQAASTEEKRARAEKERKQAVAPPKGGLTENQKLNREDKQKKIQGNIVKQQTAKDTTEKLLNQHVGRDDYGGMFVFEPKAKDYLNLSPAAQAAHKAGKLSDAEIRENRDAVIGSKRYRELTKRWSDANSALEGAKGEQ